MTDRPILWLALLFVQGVPDSSAGTVHEGSCCHDNRMPSVRLENPDGHDALPPGPDAPASALPPDYWLTLAEVDMRFGRWTLAEQRLREALGHGGDDATRARCLWALAQLRARRKEVAQALDLLDRAVRLALAASCEKDACQYRMTTARVHEQMGELGKAEAVYRARLDAAPTRVERYMARRQLLLFWKRTGQLDAAAERFERQLKEQPDDMEALHTLRQIHVSIQPNPKKAVLFTEMLASSDPDDADYGMCLLTAYVNAGELDKAIALAKALKGKHAARSVELQARLVPLYLRAGRNDEGRRAAEESFAASLPNSRSHAKLALVYQRLGMWDEAVKQYESAAQLAPNDRELASYLLRAADCARRAGKMGKARRCLTRLLTGQPLGVIEKARRLLDEIQDKGGAPQKQATIR